MAKNEMTSTKSTANKTTYLHLSYLQQVSDLLENEHKPLAARLSFIAKKISSKHQIHINGADVPKLRHCKACQAPITCDNIRSKSKSLVVKCSLCGFTKSYSHKSKEVKKEIANTPPVE